jgi:hypothetical protein
MENNENEMQMENNDNEININTDDDRDIKKEELKDRKITDYGQVILNKNKQHKKLI